jgi:hypothetical protein
MWQDVTHIGRVLVKLEVKAIGMYLRLIADTEHRLETNSFLTWNR